MKKCTKCGQTKPLEDFHKDRRSKTGKYHYCKECAKAKASAWKQSNLERSQENQRESRRKKPRHYRNKQLMWAFGITLEEYEKMRELQGGVCAICNQPETEIHPQSKRLRNLTVDHNHQTGEIRGLLCNRCNRAIGLMNDNPTILRSAISYLESKDPRPEPGVFTN